MSWTRGRSAVVLFINLYRPKYEFYVKLDFLFCSRPLVAQCSFLLQCLRAAQSISMSKYVVNDWEHEYLGSMTLNTASILNTRSDLLFVYFVYSVFMAVMSPSLHFTHLHLLFVAGCFFSFHQSYLRSLPLVTTLSEGQKCSVVLLFTVGSKPSGQSHERLQAVVKWKA